MTPSNVFNTDIRRGDCWVLQVTWQPVDTVLDLFGYTAEFAISWPRQPSGNGVAVAGEITATPTIDIDTNVITINLEAEDTEDIPNISTARYQLRLVASDGCKTTVAVGNLTVLGDFIGA